VSTTTERTYGESTFARSLEIQFRVLGALLMREVLTRFGRHNLGVLWLFLEPMLFTLGIMGLWYVSRLPSHGISIAAFCITGYSSVLLWRNCATRATMAIPPNYGLLYHRNVRVLDLMLARILLEIAGASLSFAGLVCFFVALGAMEWPVDLAGVLIGWLLLAWFGTGLAILIGAVTAFSDLIEKLWGPVTYIMFPLSGAVFMVDWLPVESQKWALYIPMVHGVEIIREGYFGSAVRTHYDIGYLTIWCMLLTLFGLALIRKAGRAVELP
jgi:capsular polysaccharide transport system permease protein